MEKVDPCPAQIEPLVLGLADAIGALFRLHGPICERDILYGARFAEMR